MTAGESAGPAALQADEWGIVPAPHLCEVYLACAMARAFLERHGGERLKIFAPSGLHDLARLFPEAPIELLDTGRLPAATPSRADQRRPGTPFLWRHDEFDLDQFARHTREGADGELGAPFVELYLSLLDLAPRNLDLPERFEAVAASARQRFEALGLRPGATVILAPFSYTLPTFSPPVWRRLADRLAERGFTVCTNVSPAEVPRAVPGTVPLTCTASELLPISEMAGRVIAIRSGVCDILCTARTRLTVLFHAQDWSPSPRTRLLWRLADNGLPDRAEYLRAMPGEGVEAFIQRILGDHSPSD